MSRKRRGESRTRDADERTTLAPTNSRTPTQRAGYDVARATIRTSAACFLRMRTSGVDRVPAEGPVIVCCNHQSSFDPALVGGALPRRLSFLARHTLFDRPLAGRIVAFFGAIPLDRTGFSREGLKVALQRLRAGEAVLIFPEGSRTNDGQMAPLRPGVGLLARQSGATLLPVALAGAYEMWPKRNSMPWPTTVHLAVGEPLAYDDPSIPDDETLLAELERRMRSCFAEATASRKKAMGPVDGRDGGRSG